VTVLLFVLTGALMGTSALSSDFCVAPTRNLLESFEDTSSTTYEIVEYYTNCQSENFPSGEEGPLGDDLVAAKNEVIDAKSQIGTAQTTTTTCGAEASNTQIALDGLATDCDNIIESLDSISASVECEALNVKYFDFLEAVCGDDGVVIGLIHVFVASMIAAVFLLVSVCVLPNTSRFEGEVDGHLNEPLAGFRNEPTRNVGAPQFVVAPAVASSVI